MHVMHVAGCRRPPRHPLGACRTLQVGGSAAHVCCHAPVHALAVPLRVVVQLGSVGLGLPPDMQGGCTADALLPQLLLLQQRPSFYVANHGLFKPTGQGGHGGHKTRDVLRCCPARVPRTGEW